MPTTHKTQPIDRLIRLALVTLAAMLVVLLILVIVFFATKPPKEPAVPADTTPTEQPATDTVTLPQTPDAGAEYQNSLIFVGDSLTAHLRSHGVLKGGTETKQVWTGVNNTITLTSEINAVKIVYPETGEKMTIPEAAAKGKPSILVINLGINGVSFLEEADFKNAYSSLIKAVKAASPDTRIILQSIYPVTDFGETKNITNARIDIANKWVKDVAAEQGCRYLDTQSILKDEKNNLKAEYCNNPDGIHMGKNAYVSVLEYVRTHALTD
jgi:lysophospholipase L1-like esterase